MASILLIDSNPEIVEIYARGLVAAGFEVSAATSAQSALDALDELDIDLIVIEIALPVHNGLTVIYELTSYSDWAKIPVLILSSVPKDNFNSPDEVWEKLNVVEYMHKLKTRPSDLAAAVKKVINENN